MDETMIRKAFKFLEKEEIFKRVDSSSEDGGYCAYVFEDRKGWGHTIIFELENEKMEWYFFDSKTYDHIESDRGRDLKETEPWFQKLIERVEKSFESLKRNLKVS